MDSYTVSINHLPNELLVKIFSLLSVEDLALNVQFVCRRWLEISSQDVLWKGSEFTAKDTQTFEYISSVLERAPKLKSFCMHKPTTEIVRVVAKHTKDLRTITVVDFWDRENSANALLDLLVECKKLEDITLPHDVLTNRKLAELAGQLKNLRSICLRGITIDRLILKTVADGCPALWHLDIRSLSWEPADLKYFLQKQDRLSSLRISNVVLGSNECALSLIAAYGKNLQTLHLDVFSDHSHPAPIGEIKKLPGLKSLQIAHPRGLSPDLIADVFRRQTMSKLVELKIEDAGSEVDSTVVKTICLNCPNLLSLGLKGCFALKDDALECLHECPQLEELDLFFCISLRGDAAEHIFRCNNLKYLNIGPWSVLREIFGHLMHQSEQNEFRALSFESAELRFSLSSLRSRWQKWHVTGNE